MGARLRLVTMTTSEALTHRRRGWWIKTAREKRGMTLAAVADALGYANGQGTVSLWEKGDRPVPSGKFPELAVLLNLPAAYLVNPPETDEERLDAAIRSATDAEHRDWAKGPRRVRGVADVPDDEPGRRSA